MTLQSLCICVEIWIAAVVYVIMDFVSVPEIAIVIADICWMFTHGDTPFVYLILNKSLRKAVFNMIRNITKHRVYNPNANSTKVIQLKTITARTSVQ
uniref:G-protein coupled receptors family 1 profile domain-containing protein n=1 Tax=Acrobeloides nanus TaxID=290746 RepID=A0A914CJN8_9BILA